MAWCFEDETSLYSERFLDHLSEGAGSAVVPGIWLLEVPNVLWVAERKKRITPAHAERFLALLDSLSIQADERSPFLRPPTILALARAADLSAYDAAYLELAERLALPLATLDRRLRGAAEERGVEIRLDFEEQARGEH